LAAEISFWKRHRARILFLLGVAVVFGLTYALRSVLLPFLVGLVLAAPLTALIVEIYKYLRLGAGSQEATRVAEQ
jgi:hypothetical protein